jgi:thioredoxin 1
MKLKLAFYIGLIYTLTISSFTHESQETKAKIFTITDAHHFQEVLDKYEFVVVDFYANWCYPCVSMHKVIDWLAQQKEFEGITFLKVNIEEQKDLANRYHVRSLPTLIFFVDGQPIRTVHGYVDKKELKAIIQKTFF